MKTYCILLASGTGSRFGGDIPKQFIKINGRMIIEYTLDACDCGIFDRIVLVVSDAYLDAMRLVVSARDSSAHITVVAGGASRIESCAKGLAVIEESDGYVVIHNGVQPFVTEKSFLSCIATLHRYSMAISAIPCVYTILQSDDGTQVNGVPDRHKLYCDMGIEGFNISVLRRILANTIDSVASANFVGLASAKGLGPIGIFAGDAANIKITYPEDVVYATERLMRKGDSDDA